MTIGELQKVLQNLIKRKSSNKRYGYNNGIISR